MRVFVLALAILLLPLRGWLGDAMAIETVQPAAGVHATHDMAAMSHDGHDGHDGAAEPAQSSPSPSPSPSPDCKSACGDCQLCHSVAMAVWPALGALPQAPSAAPAFAPTSFASAEPAPGLKPPIS